MKDIIIIGAGGYGREIYCLIKRINAVIPTWNVKGFLDDNIHALDGKNCDRQIIGKICEWEPAEDEFFAMGIASPCIKEKVSTLLKAKGAKFPVLISPTAIVHNDFAFGEGCIISGHSIVGDNAHVGNFVHISSSMIGQDAVIGDYSTTTGYANVTTAKLGRRVFVGSHAVILNDMKIGDDAFICAGSIVVRNVKAGMKVFGNPARKLEL